MVASSPPAPDKWKCLEDAPSCEFIIFIYSSEECPRGAKNKNILFYFIFLILLKRGIYVKNHHGH